MTPVTRGRNDLWGGLIVAIGVVLAITAFAGVSLFQIGAVGFFVWLALARKQGWAWLPAAFFGFHLAQDLFDGVGGSLFFPLMVVAAGVLLLSRDRMSKNATIGILVMLAVVGIASNNRDGGPRFDVQVDPPGVPAEPDAPDQELPEQTQRYDLDGRRLVIQAGSRDLVLTRSRNSQVVIGAEEGFEIFEERDLARLQIPDGDDPLEIAIPAESEVAVRSVSGDIAAEVGALALDIDTVVGDIDVELDGPHAVTARTADGEIEADGIQDFDDSPNLLASEARGSRVRLESISGSISISQT
ncbi:MAG TPA: DUF4097 family beta strand repeat-containing protein [Acidimicrobiales bacterium]|nr:DUF4097 family beta strand repeat-containing protein [Acidimicrobiales bacterium]